MRAERIAAVFGLVFGLTAAVERSAAVDDPGTPELSKTPSWLVKFPYTPEGREAQLAVGRELFLREWIPGDPRSRGGDGLGPVYNANSCATCHRLGGAGGAGGNDVNVEIAAAIITSARGEPTTDVPLDPLFDLHPDFRSVRALVLHRKGVDPRYADWRRRVDGWSRDRITIRTVERNTPALFGDGLIDTIPEAAIEAGARATFPGFAEVHGRVARLPGGKVGRFGWKGQTASLGDFVRTACAVEMGLEVPGHPQSINPATPAEKAPALDLTEDECEALTRFVASLPAPGHRPLPNRGQVVNAEQGRKTFLEIGCATCHAPRLGDVDGLYSDLLLHDLGNSLADGAIYYGSPAPPSPQQQQLAAADQPARPSEWRTPPLWGLRDSAPYLHDGRAKSLDEAIRLHDGEAKGIRDRYASLKLVERKQIYAFLMTLSAPKDIVPVRAGPPLASRP
jgi:CxxC motif-containing protein (DUF1111 family)